MRAFASVAVVLPLFGDQSVHMESSEGCIGSSKFHTVKETGTVALP